MNYGYNSFGQVNSISLNGHSIDYQYDTAGRVNAIGIDNANWSLIKYNQDRLGKIQTNGSLNVSNLASDNAVYNYNPDGSLESVTYPNNGSSNVIKSSYIYNDLGRLTSVSNTKDNSPISSYTYHYDANGNIDSITDANGTASYGYDNLDRLETVTKNGVPSQQYSYDARGNRKTLLGSSPEIPAGEISYNYNLWNQLTSIQNGQNTSTFTDGPTGLRVKKGSKSYIYDANGNVAAEADANNTITATYVWGGNRLLVKKLANGAQYYYLYNGHGDVVQIVDTTGNVVNSYQYDEWGNITSQTEGIENEFKYAGQIYDSETGLYYLRARYYDPVTGRFISKDSYEGDITNPLSLNLYTYVENNPVKYFDPTGHATYQIGGLELAPTFEFDSGFQYDSNAVATDADKKSWNEWGRKAWAAGLVPWLKDAAKMYKHYRGNTGTDMRIDYGRAYKEDDTIKAGIDNEISLMQNFVNSSYKGGAGTSFDIIGDLQGISNGTSENWQKTIGAFYTYGYGQVSIDPNTGTATMVVTFYMEDMYNFNPGMADIASGTPDAVNGRFAQLGWAKEFKTYGSFTKTITWNINGSSSTSTQTRGGR